MLTSLLSHPLREKGKNSHDLRSVPTEATADESFVGVLRSFLYHFDRPIDKGGPCHPAKLIFFPQSARYTSQPGCRRPWWTQLFSSSPYWFVPMNACLSSHKWKEGVHQEEPWVENCHGKTRWSTVMRRVMHAWWDAVVIAGLRFLTEIGSFTAVYPWSTKRLISSWPTPSCRKHHESSQRTLNFDDNYYWLMQHK